MRLLLSKNGWVEMYELDPVDIRDVVEDWYQIPLIDLYSTKWGVHDIYQINRGMVPSS